MKATWVLLLLLASLGVAVAQPGSPPDGAFGFEFGAVLENSLRRGCDLGEWCRVLPRERQPRFDRYAVRITPGRGRIYRIAATRFLDDMQSCRAQARQLRDELARDHDISFNALPAAQRAPLVRAAWRWALPASGRQRRDPGAAFEILIRCKGPAISSPSGSWGRTAPAATLKLFLSDYRLLK